jgi:hypothetical protein
VEAGRSIKNAVAARTQEIFLKFETLNLGKIKFMPFTSAVLDDYYKDIKPAHTFRATRCNPGNTGRYRQDLFHWRTIPWVNIIQN